MPKKMKSQYSGKCRKCHFDYYPGEEINWYGKGQVEHVVCPTSKPTPPPGFDRGRRFQGSRPQESNLKDELFKIAFAAALKGHPDQWPSVRQVAAQAKAQAEEAYKTWIERGSK